MGQQAEAVGADPLRPAPESKPADEGLSARQRLRRSGLFAETYAQERCYRGRYMVLWLRQGEGAALRLGVVTSRKVGEAVVRVRARRMLREAFRRNRRRLTGAVDVVLVARASLLTATPAELAGELLRLAERAGLLRPANTG